MTIKFGTDGWRAIMAQDFTFANVDVVVQAVANYLKEEKKDEKTVVIGYDNRFLSPEFAKRAAEVLAGNNISVLIGEKVMPTPVTAFAITRTNSAGALMFTASHNPPTYNGVKFIPHYGGPALPEITDRIEAQVKQVEEKREINAMEYDEAKEQGLLKAIDPAREYREQLLTLVDKEAIAKAKLKVAIDPMFGAGVGYLEELLSELKCEFKSIHNYRDPLFGGKMPEPSDSVLTELKQLVIDEKANLGLALDGDADRFGIMDQDSQFITANQVLSLLYLHLQKKGVTGPCTKTVSTTQMLNRIAEKNCQSIYETPVGFKFIGQNLMERDCVIGGEESGGLSIRGHVPEKDGLLACLLMVELVASTGKTLGQLLEEMYQEYGLLVNERLDIHCSPKDKERVLAFLKTWRPDEISGVKVTETITVDGVKYVRADGSWVLIRPSGTEPLFRIYGETESMEELKQLQQAVRDELKI